MEPTDTIAHLLSFSPEGWGDNLFWAALVTVKLAVTSLGFALIFGFALAGCKLSPWRISRWFGSTYTFLVRGVPEFLILLIVFFGSEQLINGFLQLVGFEGRIEVPKFAAAVAGLALIFSAYICEIFRGAYLAVPKGQIEAAQAIGLSPAKVFLRVRFPQLWRFAIPGLGNLWMVLLKDTSLAAVLALDELLRMAKLAGETEQKQLLFFALAGLIYLLLTSFSDIGRLWLERRARRGIRPA